MSDITPQNSLSLMAQAQAQKHVTYNTSIVSLDTIVRTSVISRGLIDPPASPTHGDTYLIDSGATGAWVGEDDNITTWNGFNWDFFPAKVGWSVWVEDEGIQLTRNNSSWLLSFRPVQVTTAQVSSGTLPVDSTQVVVEQETGTTDDIDTIAGLEDGETLVISGPLNGSVTINNSGNIKLAATRTLNSPFDTVCFVKRGSNFLEIIFRNNA